MYRAGPRYRPSGAFCAWLYQIALNVVRDAARRQRVRRIALPDELTKARAVVASEEPADGSALPVQCCHQQELARAMAQALAELPEPLRLAVVLRHYEQMSFAEIARLTGQPASTVKSRFAAALARLRTSLEQAGWGQEDILP